MSGLSLSRRAFLSLTGAAFLMGAKQVSQNDASSPFVMLGDEIFVRERWRELAGKRVGIVTNQTGALSSGELLIDAVHRNPRISLRALFAPEHGIRGQARAGALVASSVDESTGLPIHSLYGKTRHPTREMLADVDALLVDLQDVGDRAYTYISTLAYVMQAAKAFDKEVWVLDRPNPLGGASVEGPVLQPAFSSFIGLYPIALRHGMTIGELAQLFNEHFGIGCKLNVVAMRGYTRDMLWPDTGLSWIPTSPNIPTWQTTLVYPCTGMLGAAGMNNGTGSVVPFQPFFFAGAYGLDGKPLAAFLNERALDGVTFRPASWTPQAGFWGGKTLTGIELLVQDPYAFRPVRTAVEILVALRTIAPKFLHMEPDKLDHDWGTDSLRLGLHGGLNADQIEAQWTPGLQAFETARARYLLYET